MHETLQFLARHGHVVIFVFVLAEQLGAPIPAVPVLLAAGALAGEGQMGFAAALAWAVLASLIADSVWYALGRRRGQGVLRLLCRISLEPDSCVSDARSWFVRLGEGALLIAKFVPGLSTIAPPMAGVTNLACWRFLLADAAGAFAWAGASMWAGYLFRRQIESIADRALMVGSRFGLVVAIVLAVYVGLKYWQRRRFVRSLRVSRVTPDELYAMIQAGCDIAIVDLRHEMEFRGEGEKIPGAIWFDRSAIADRRDEIPQGRDVVLYCT